MGNSHDSIFRQPPLQGFRFLAKFLQFGIFPTPFDMWFSKVSGIGVSVDTREIGSGGRNDYTHKIPNHVNYENLVLERGLTSGIPSDLDINLLAMSQFKFAPGTVIVVVLNEASQPKRIWTFLKAYPTKWKIGDLDANQSGVLIETIELTYTQFLPLKLP
ncbi:MAG: hypothetical protein RLZZ165_1326 [Bacteroidota bacterium]|jgi:phage tail-like protein